MDKAAMIEQVDREAAAALFRDERTDLAVKFRLGANPEPLLEAFAAHRLAERARIVAWLREQMKGAHVYSVQCAFQDAADSIEQGAV